MNNIQSNKKELSPKQREELLKALKARFEKNLNRHKGLEWAKVHAKLEASAEKLWSLNEMERTGGEPDVVGQDKKSGEYIFFDCSEQTPEGRVSLCYDREALDGRKEHKPRSSVLDMAAAMGIEVLTEEQYFTPDDWRWRPSDLRQILNADFLWQKLKAGCDGNPLSFCCQPHHIIGCNACNTASERTRLPWSWLICA